MSWPVPAKPSLVIGFVAYLFEKGRAPTSISSHLSAIAYVHKLQSLDDPTSNFLVRKIMVGAHKLSGHPDMRLPITPEILKGLVMNLSFSTQSQYVLKMLKAMFLMAFFAFLRIGEITARSPSAKSIIHFKNVVFTKSLALVTLSEYKHNVKKQPVTLSLKPQPGPLCPISALKAYIKIRGQSQGPLFCWPNLSPVTRTFFNQQLQKVVKMSGLNPSGYKGHSFRIGAATCAAMQGSSEEKNQGNG